MQPTHQSSIEQQMASLDSCFQIIASFIDALQKNFKQDTRYAYPLMLAQANTLFTLDEDVAMKMKSYIGCLMKDFCGFNESDFSIMPRPPMEEGGLFKLRIEFKQGIDFELIQKILEKTANLEDRLLQITASQ